MTKTALPFAALLSTLIATEAATVTFDFEDTGALDGVTAPTVMSVTENSETVVLTTLSISAPDFGEGDPYANLTTVDHETNIASNSGAGGLGINNDTTGNTDFNTATGAGSSESSNINYLESVTFELDQTVTFTNIDFDSLGGSVEFLRINIEGVATNYDFFNGNSGDVFPDPLSGLLIAAGTDITFTGLGGAGDTNLRVAEFTVDVVPEPSASLLGLAGALLLIRRRR